MSVDKASAKSAVYQDQVYYFCSQTCREKFEAAPTTYAKTAGAAPHANEHRHGCCGPAGRPNGRRVRAFARRGTRRPAEARTERGRRLKAPPGRTLDGGRDHRNRVRLRGADAAPGAAVVDMLTELVLFFLLDGVLIMVANLLRKAVSAYRPPAGPAQGSGGAAYAS
jgi:YHS domain-containing protein